MITTTDLTPARASADAASAGAGQLTSLLSWVVTPDRIDEANATAKAVREYRKTLDAEEKRGTKPLLEVVETIRSWFRDPKAACDRVYAHLTEGVARCLAESRAASTKALAEAAATGAGAAEIQRAVEVAAAKPAASKQLVFYSVRVVDAAKVPAMFLRVDQQALDAHARAVKDAFSVPGCELIRDVRVVPL